MLFHLRVALYTVFAVVMVVGAASSAQAQSSSPMSIQLSGAGLVIAGGIVPGAEVQARFTGRRLSLGGGYQVFTKDGARSDVVFVEPRARVANTSNAAIYAAARAGFVTSSQTAVFGGGGGLLIAAGRNRAVDVGAQVYSTDAKSVVTQVRVGISLGF